MRFFIHTLGCAKNEFDSSALARLLVEAGFEPSTSFDRADVILLNTCGFLESALEETSEVARAISQSISPGQRFVIMGCAVNYLKRRIAEVVKADLYVEIGAIQQIPSLLAASASGYVGGDGLLPCRTAQEGKPAVYLKVAEGCSNRCSYCAIPLIRGGTISYPADAVIAEAVRLAGSGSREFNLIAQDAASYNHEGTTIAALVARLSRQLAGELDEFWIRLLYVNPDSVDGDLLDRLFSTAGVVPYLEMPVQSGSPQILRQMNRRRHPDEILEMVNHLRRWYPELVVRTSFLVGFPGETDADFARTLEFMRALNPDYVAVFPYSRMPGTRAEKMKQQVPHDVILERARELQEEADAIMLDRRLSRVGRTVRVLIEQPGVQSRGRFYGQAPEVDGEVIIEGRTVRGMYYDIELLDVEGYDYAGKVRNG